MDDFSSYLSLFSDEPSDEEQAQAMIDALRRRQGEADAQKGALQATLGRQEGKAGDLRTMALLTSMGANPVLQGLSHTSGQMADNLENLAGRTEQRLALAKSGAPDPLRMVALTQAAQRLKQAAAAEKRRGEDSDEGMALRKAMLALKQQSLAQAADKATKADAKQAFTTEKDLRQELLHNPATKQFQDVSVAYDKMRSAAAVPSAAGDLSLIFGYMKMLDPGSTVREGEFANAQNAGGVDTRVQAAYNRILNGERLTEAQRADFMRQAQGLYGAQKSAYEKLAKGYKGLAQQSGAAPERVALPLGLDLEETPPPAPVKAAPPSKPINPYDFTRVVDKDGVKMGQRKDGSIVVIHPDGSLEPVTIKE